MANIIDFHTHLGTSKAAFYEEQGEKALSDYCANPQKLLKSMAKNGITKSVVFSVPMISNQQRDANYEVLDMALENESLILFAYLDPRLRESPDLLEELVEKGCKGLKLHPVCHGYVVSHSLCYPTIEVAKQHGLPVLIHTGWGEYGEIRFIAKLAQDFKDLNIIIAHLIEHKDIFALIPPYGNVSVETSYSSHPRRISQAVNALGRERVLFGSDFPCSDPGFELYKIRRAPISDPNKENILYRNALRLLKLD
jgi:hypothetical protein